MRKGWTTKKLGEIIRLEYGKSLADFDRNPNGLYPAYGANGIKDKTDKFYKDVASIIVGRKGSAGEVTLTEDRYWPLDVTFFVEFDRAKYELQYLYFLLLTLNLPSMAKGVKPGINRNDVYDITVTTPDIEEQRRIVTLLDEAFADIATATANAKKNLQNARELFDNALQSLVDGISKDWKQQTMAEVCDITSKLVDPREDQYLELPHVGAGNIESKTSALVDVKTAREETLISGKFLFDESMVLYSKIRPYLMKVVRPDFNGLCSADIYPLAPKADVITRDYLYYLLLAPAFTEYAIKGSARAGMPKVNREYLFAYQFALPTVQEQRRIAEKLDALATETNHLESIYRQKLNALDNLKMSLLHKAFSGQL